MIPVPIVSRYFAVCALCDDVIRPGSPIYIDECFEYVHRECADEQ